MPLHPQQDGNNGRRVLTIVDLDSAATFGVEAVRSGRSPPGSVPMLHKDDTRVRHMVEGHTGDKR
jgi:hypothetical protein